MVLTLLFRSSRTISSSMCSAAPAASTSSRRLLTAQMAAGLSGQTSFSLTRYAIRFMHIIILIRYFQPQEKEFSPQEMIRWVALPYARVHC